MSKMKYVAMLIQSGRIEELRKATMTAKEAGKERVWFDNGYISFEFAEAIINYAEYQNSNVNSNHRQ